MLKKTKYTNSVLLPSTGQVKDPSHRDPTRSEQRNVLVRTSTSINGFYVLLQEKRAIVELIAHHPSSVELIFIQEEL